MSKLTVAQYLACFKDKRLIQIFVFGVASGFPWVLIGSVMSAWLKDEGLSRSAIGLFGIVFTCYSINFLWSPLLDRIKSSRVYRPSTYWIIFLACALEQFVVLVYKLGTTQK